MYNLFDQIQHFPQLLLETTPTPKHRILYDLFPLVHQVRLMMPMYYYIYGLPLKPGNLPRGPTNTDSEDSKITQSNFLQEISMFRDIDKLER